MKIEENKVIGISYILNDVDGELIDESEKDQPFELLVGGGQIVPGLEKALMGMAVGDKKTVTLEPKDGYGEDDPELRVIVSRSQFPADVEVKPGFEFVTELENGENQAFTVFEVEGDDVKIDGNHPLAGETLVFQIEILSVREPTKKELDAGHIHGPDCDH